MKLFSLLLIFSLFVACGPSTRRQQADQQVEAVKLQQQAAEKKWVDHREEGLQDLVQVCARYDSLGAFRESIACRLKISDLYRRYAGDAKAFQADSIALRQARANAFYDLEFDALVSAFLSTIADTARANPLLREAEQLVNRHHLEDKKARLFYEKGLVEVEYALEEGLLLLEKGKKIAEAGNQQLLLAKILCNIALAEIQLTHYEKAVDNALRAISIQEKENERADLAVSYNVLALVYGCTGEKQKQWQYNQHALQLMEQERRTDIELIHLLNNIAHGYAATFPDSSFFYYNKALAVSEAQGLTASKPSILLNLGNLYLKVGQMDSAVKYMTISRAMIEKIPGEKTNLKGNLYAHFSIMYQQQKEIQLSIVYAQKALDVFSTTSSFGIAGSCKQLAEMYRLQGDYKNAHAYLLRFIQMKDSMFNIDVDRKMVRLSAVHEIEKKDAALALSEKSRQLLDLEVKEKQSSVIQLSAISLLLLVLVGIVLFFLKQKSRNEQELRQKNERINHLMNEMTHRVKNNFQVLSNVFSLQVHSENAGSGLIRENKARVDALLLLHQKLAVDDNLRKINPVEYIDELTGYLVMSYGFPAESVKKDYTATVPGIDVDRLMPLGLIVNELITNAMKHAFKGVENPELYIGLQMISHDICVLTVRDNGIAEEAAIKSNPGSLGMRLLHIFARQLQGRLTNKIDKGLEWTLEFNTDANFPT